MFVKSYPEIFYPSRKKKLYWCLGNTEHFIKTTQSLFSQGNNIRFYWFVCKKEFCLPKDQQYDWKVSLEFWTFLLYKQTYDSYYFLQKIYFFFDSFINRNALVKYYTLLEFSKNPLLGNFYTYRRRFSNWLNFILIFFFKLTKIVHTVIPLFYRLLRRKL